MLKDNVIQFPFSERDLELVKGQYIHVEHNEEAGYIQGVVTAVFDKFALIKMSGSTLRYCFDSEDDRYNLVIPTKDGKRVMAKKKLFGGYKIEPRL